MISIRVLLRRALLNQQSQSLVECEPCALRHGPDGPAQEPRIETITRDHSLVECELCERIETITRDTDSGPAQSAPAVRPNDERPDAKARTDTQREDSGEEREVRPLGGARLVLQYVLRVGTVVNDLHGLTD